MIFIIKSIKNDFTIKMHKNWFYYENALEMIFTGKMQQKRYNYKNTL